MKAYCLESLGLGSVGYIAVADRYSRARLLLCPSGHSRTPVLGFHSMLNKPRCLFHKCKAAAWFAHLLPRPSFIWPIPPHSRRLVTGPTLAGQHSQGPLLQASSHLPPLLLWAAGPHPASAQPSSWVTASVNSAVRSDFTVNALKVEILSFVVSTTTSIPYTRVVGALKVSVPWCDEVYNRTNPKLKRVYLVFKREDMKDINDPYLINIPGAWEQPQVTN